MTSIGFDADSIMDGVAETLLAAEIPLGRLNAHVMNLFQLAAGFMAQPRARSTQIMWRHAVHLAFQKSALYDTPGRIGAEPVRRDWAIRGPESGESPRVKFRDEVTSASRLLLSSGRRRARRGR